MKQFRSDMQQDFEAYALRVEQVLDQMREKAEDFLDDKLHIGNIVDIIARREKLVKEFEAEVGDGADQVDELQAGGKRVGEGRERKKGGRKSGEEGRERGEEKEREGGERTREGRREMGGERRERKGVGILRQQ